MARRAFKHQSNDRRFALFFVKAAALLAIAAAPYLIFFGVPLFGLPEAEDVTSVEITYFHTKERKTFSGFDDIKLARKAAGLLRRLPFASLTEEDPRYTLVFAYKGRMMRGPYRQGELFVKTVDGIFRR